MSARYQTLFGGTAASRTAVIPFLVLGDPDFETSARLLDALADAGIDAIELGLPFSDPVADGPVIQAASVRALAAGATPERGWRLVERLRQRAPELPIGLLVYANLVVHRGISEFYRRAAEARADSVLVADVPLAEADPFLAEAARHGIAPVMIAPPNASAERLERIAQVTRGYTYVTSRAGVTGTRGPDPDLLGPTLARLRALGAPPPGARLRDLRPGACLHRGSPRRTRRHHRIGADRTNRGRPVRGRRPRRSRRRLHRGTANGLHCGGAADG